MSAINLRDKYIKALEDRRQDVTDQLLAGVKDISQYEFLRGRYSSLADAENIFRELLGNYIDEDDQSSSGS
tara:strand:+ start:9918 stop:10130 length:213 start_codon:yes stop_codon:yes gene_type:complete